jgi:hypothetical protein
VSARLEPQADLQSNVSSDVQANARDAASANASLALQPALLAPPVETVDPDGWGNGPSLPSDHPAWMRDAISLSQRARALLARVKPVAIRVLAFWEHRLKSIEIGGRTLSIDASGSYRFDV